MYDFENLYDSTAFSTIKNNDVSKKFKWDSDDENSDSTIILEANDRSPKIKSGCKLTSPRTSVYNNSPTSSYPSTSKMPCSDDKLMYPDKTTSNYYKVNDYYFSNTKVDSQIESILLKYGSPSSKAANSGQNQSSRNNKFAQNCEPSTSSTKYELIELSSDDDDYLLKTQINDVNTSISTAINDQADIIIKQLSHKYKSKLNEKDKDPTKFKIKDSRLCSTNDSTTFKNNMLDFNKDKLSNELSTTVEADCLAWTNLKRDKEESSLTNICDEEYKQLTDKYNTISDNNGINTETNCLNILQKENSPNLYKSPKKKRKLTTAKNNEKSSKADIQAKKREEAEMAKKLKQALLAANKNMKPEECMKFITVLLDSEMTNENYVGDVLNSLQAASITYRLQPQLIPHTITWNRMEKTHFIDTDQQFTATSKSTETSEVLLILKWKEIVELVHNRSLVTHVKSLRSILGNKKLSLAIYGMENYFKYQRSQKQKGMRTDITGSPQRTKNKYDKIYKDAAKINMKQLEFALAELQLLCCCCHRMVETADDLGAMIVQFTKSIAQIPYKLEKQRKEQEAQWFISGDNKDCVHVDKNGNGLQRLWQQQLTTFPLARLEHAEAIVAKYATPTSLMEAYNFCTQTEGEKLLQDIPIRRAAGPLTTVRKIGPELSKKIYKFFTSTDGNEVL